LTIVQGKCVLLIDVILQFKPQTHPNYGSLSKDMVKLLDDNRFVADEDEGAGELPELDGGVEDTNGERVLEKLRRCNLDKECLKEELQQCKKALRHAVKLYHRDSLSKCSHPSCTKKEILNERRFLWCSRCMIPKYCGKECQLAHWKYHKKWCYVEEPEMID
jgi:hypothetical protein